MKKYMALKIDSCSQCELNLFDSVYCLAMDNCEKRISAIKSGKVLE